MCRLTAIFLFITNVLTSVVFAAVPTKPVVDYQVYSDTAAELFWRRSTGDSLVVSYEVIRNNEVLILEDALSYFDDNLSPGIVYSYSVTAIDSQGGRSPATNIKLSTTETLPDPTLVACEVVRFPEDTRLHGLTGKNNLSNPLHVRLPNGEYSISLSYEDQRHNDPNVASQLNEQWLIEGLDRNGHIIFTTSATNDLPDSSLAASTVVGKYDISHIASVRARHAHVSDHANSITPTHVTFLRPFCVSDPNAPDNTPPTDVLNFSIVDSDITDTSIRVTWKAAADNVGVSAYSMRINSVFTDVVTVEENSELSYTFKDLQPGSSYLLGIEARDAAGNFSRNLTTLQATTSGESSSGISLEPDPLPPFQCRGVSVPTDEFGVISGFLPNEPVRVELNGSLLSSRPADSNGSRSLRWRCETGGTLNFVASGGDSGQTIAFQLNTLANNYASEPCGVEEVFPLEMPIQARVLGPIGIPITLPVYSLPADSLDCRDPTGVELRPSQVITIVAVTDNYAQLGSPFSGWLPRVVVEEDFPPPPDDDTNTASCICNSPTLVPSIPTPSPAVSLKMLLDKRNTAARCVLQYLAEEEVGLPVGQCGPVLTSWESAIMEQASNFGVSPLLLASIIYHEGGNTRIYGDHWKNIENASALGNLQFLDSVPLPTIPSSVGVAQVKIRTASTILERKFGTTLDSDIIRRQLIFNDDFSIQLAAAYICELRSIVDFNDVSDYERDRRLFLAYASSSERILDLNSVEWDLDLFERTFVDANEFGFIDTIRARDGQWSEASSFVLTLQEFFLRFGGLGSDGFCPIFI